MSFRKLTIDHLEVNNRRVLMRADFNVPLKQGKVADDTRIMATLPTIRALLERGASVVLMSHLGRPKNGPDSTLSLGPVARRLSERLDLPVRFVTDCVGSEVEAEVSTLASGEVLLLENLRFHAAEEANDPDFAAALARLGDLFVNDAFGSAHRAHASTEGITHFVERAAAGFLMEKELRYLGGVLESPQRPFVAILGGAKISDKIEVIENLLGKVDCLLIGGAMAFTFLKSQGKSIGKSLCEEDKLDLARQLLARAGDIIALPIDAIASPSIEDEASAHAVSVDRIPEGEMGLDIGPKTSSQFAEIIRLAKTVHSCGTGPWECSKKFRLSPPGPFEVARMAAEATDSRGRL
jgi:phosphoglycerate kinase